MIFLNNASGRAAVIAQLAASCTLLIPPFEVHATTSFIRGGNSNNRRLQDAACSSFRKKNQCPTGGPEPACVWQKGNCVPPPAPTPTQPPTTRSPTKTTDSPTRATLECSSFRKRNDCLTSGPKPCVWQQGNCVPPPTPSPTQTPTTRSPTKATKAPTPSPSTSPTQKPTYAPNTVVATYVPGDLSVPCDNGKLTLSKGMSCELLTTAGQQVQFADGTFSSETMHERADGAGVISHPTDGGWYYVSNSETKTGGVGTLRFNANGEVIGYERTLTGTVDNCGGGRTPWNTWVSCEEDGSVGYCWEVDPDTGYTNKVKNVAQGGNYESFAYDNMDPTAPNNMRFFTTEDSSNGALVRYTPHPDAFTGPDAYSILNTANGQYDYLVLNANDGTFSWSSNIADGEASASALFPSSEGIDVHGRILSFVAKSRKELFTLDLAAMTWTKSSTVSGAFNLQPDQLARIIGDSDVLYFCEDGGSDCDIHGRDATGQYFTVVRGDGYSTETTGLAFSPNNLFMYVAFQGNSNIYKFWRDDGLPFNGAVAHTKYH